MSTVGRVVVGVDGSAQAQAALQWSLEEAHVHRWTLEVVHAQFARRPFLDLYPDLERAEEEVLHSALRQAQEQAPDVPVTASLYEPPAASALLAASEGADLLVVGSRGLGGVKTLALGSVSSECVRRAHCPVVVIRRPGPTRAGGSGNEQQPARTAADGPVKAGGDRPVQADGDRPVQAGAERSG